MATLGSRHSAMLFAVMCSAVLSPVVLTPSAIAADTRSQVMKKLAADLNQQAKDYGVQVEQTSQSAIWNENLSKLRPALNRQRQTLLTAKPLLGLLKPSQSGPEISNEVVGSIPENTEEARPTKPMARFRQKLAALATGTGVQSLTIVHVGRSSSGSGQFTSSLKSLLQTRYGNIGPGMVAPARDLLDPLEGSFELTKSGRWRVDSIRRPHKQGFGLSAMRATSRSSLSSMTITSTDGAFDWVGVTVATGPSQGTFKLKVGDVEKEFDAQADVPGSKLFKLSVAGQSATIHPGGGAQTGLLNWTAGKKQAGVRYMRFDLFSDKSKEIDRLDATLVANDLRNLRPDLLIVDHVASEGESGRAIQDLIAQMRAAAPGADILFLGPNQKRFATTQSCQGSDLTGTSKTNRQRIAPVSGAATWHWQPNRADICAAEQQLQLGLVSGGERNDAANLTSDYDARRANALVKWLANPGNLVGKVAQSQKF